MELTNESNKGLNSFSLSNHIFISGWSFNEIQHVRISSNVQREIQTIKFENWAAQNATQSTWTVMFSCSDTTTNCSGSLFHFSLFGTKSGVALSIFVFACMCFVIRLNKILNLSTKVFDFVFKCPKDTYDLCPK